MPNPAMLWMLSPSPSHIAIAEIPRSPRPPTERPITAPPLNDTSRAAGWPPVAAAIAVRPLALVAARIPQNPATTLVTAPARKAIAVIFPIATNKRAKTTVTNTASILYSAYKKAIAPS